ncbi:MAG: transporter [Limisphaerales bacterium]
MLLFCALIPQGRSQTPPGDLTELSLEQILSLHIVKRPTTTNAENVLIRNESTSWTFGYRYIHAFFSGHRRGTDSLPNGAVLGAPANGIVFPILPTDIRQEAHTLELGYRATERLSVTVLAPYIFQSTEHISLVPGFADFTIDSDGFGDVSVAPSYRIWESGNHAVIVNGGLSLPIGSINQTGDTPGPGPVNSLPYTMQIGSGTFDLLPGIAYQGSKDRLRWSVQALATIRLGRNYRGYTLGNRYALAGRFSYLLKPWLEPIVGVRFQNWQRITGFDPALPLGPPYPATVVDPTRYGGEKINLSVGTRFKITGGPFTGSAMEIQGALPVYQRLNGPQPEEQWQLNAAWKWSF